jgi:hypothetical protein
MDPVLSRFVLGCRPARPVMPASYDEILCCWLQSWLQSWLQYGRAGWPPSRDDIWARWQAVEGGDQTWQVDLDGRR